jgi:putative ABC transport system substrate-binding protein
MKSATTMLVLLFITCSAFAGHGRIAIIKSGSAAPYEASIAGLRSELNRAGISENIDEYGIPFQFPSSSQPQVIVAVGCDAIDLVAKTIHDTPIVYMMATTQSKTQANLTGISLDVSPLQQFSLCKKIVPKLRRVGVLYDPRQTRELVERGTEQAREINIEVIASKVSKIDDIYEAVRALGPRIDALWIIPDATVYNLKTTQDILLFSIQEHLPVIGLSLPYVKAGALCSSSCNYKAIGAQAAKMVEKILDGQAPSQIPPEEPEIAETSVNLITAERIGIAIPYSVVQEATNVVK